MDPKSPGLRRYLYELVFHRAIEHVQNETGEVIRVSSGCMLRARLEQNLIAAGVEGGMDNPGLGISRVLSSMEEVLRDETGYRGLFADASATNELYQSAFAQFHDFTGLRRREQGTTVEPDLGQRVPALPISPYDPRWATRCVVKREGSRLVYAPLGLIDEMRLTQGRVHQLHEVRDPAFKLHRYEEHSDRLREVGRAYNDDDATGLSELMSRMSEDEHRHVRSWMIKGVLNERGFLDPGRCMSSQALERSVAILDELRNQGMEYRVERDRNPGQLKVVLEGTGMAVRLTENRKNEDYIGRVYDSGVVTTYSTNHRPSGQHKASLYTPTPQETVDLVRFAQGKPLRRGDGGLVGQFGEHHIGPGHTRRTIPNSYFVASDKAGMFVVKELEAGGSRVPGSFVYIRRDASQRSASTWFGKADKAEEFLRQAVSSARDHMHTALDVNALVAEYQDHAEAATEGEYFPEFSGDLEVAAIQRSYWDVLRGAQTTLLRPGTTEEQYYDTIERLSESLMAQTTSQAIHQTLASQLSYAGTPEQKVRSHAEDVLDGLIGTYKAREVTGTDGHLRWERFNPGRVAERMSSQYGQFRNQFDLIAAMRVANITGEDLAGEGENTRSVRDRLISFDPASAVPAEQVQDPFVRRMAAVTAKAINRSGGQISSMQVDDNGIIRYAINRYQMNGMELPPTVGEIGQIFGLGEHGEVVTRFASGVDHMFVPGYQAHVLDQKLGEQRSVEERTVLRGYEQIMAERIEHRITSDMMTMRTHIGEPSSLNSLYRSLTDIRHEIDFVEGAQREGLAREWVEAILATEAGRVRYPNSLASGSTMHAEWSATNNSHWDEANDNYDAPFIRTGRNMVVLSEHGDGFFDPALTGNGIQQGIVRYLTADAQVNEDGTIVPGAPDSQTALASRPELATTKHDAWDRRQGTLVNLLNASAVTGREGAAMMTFGGWGLDDPVIVSQDFADKYRVRGVDGQMRPLAPGDKISDLHGNKGVLSLIVDRDAVAGVDFDVDDASLRRAHQVFADNPDLHVVMPPFSAVSRFNGGTAREMMDNPTDLTLPEQGVVPGAVGYPRYIITSKTADKGTKVYDQLASIEGRGRRASTQLAWALGAQECDQVMAEIYGPNLPAVANVREMLVSVGLELEADGTLSISSQGQADDAERRLFAMPELVHNDKGQVNFKQMRADFGMQIGDKGGQMELPFPLELPTGAWLPQVSENSWALPVMSAHLRSGQDLGDGISSVHEYTRHYLDIFKHACMYRHAVGRLAVEKDPKKVRDFERIIQKSPSMAQESYDGLTDDLIKRRFTGKRNVFRQDVMSRRLPNSATAVWTCDPRLDIDQLAMGPAMADALGFSEGAYAMIWRDPVLRDGGVRYMRVVIDERLTGVAINPVMDKSFDGDFDGDSVGVFRLTSQAAKNEAAERLSVEANLLDLGTQDKNGFYPLAMQDALDVKVSQYVRPELAERFAKLKQKANDHYSDLMEGTLDRATFLEKNRELVGELSTYYRHALENQYGDAVLRFDSTQEHMNSVIKACIEPEAKGSHSKLMDYARYLGVDPDTFVDLGEPQHTRENDAGTMIATAIKAHGTGIAGMFSQRGVKALRGKALESVLELTQPVTQSLLQAKHDPAEARHKYDMVMGPARSLWKGRKMDKVEGVSGPDAWQVIAGTQATPEEWVQTFVQMYTSRDGLDVAIAPDHVETVARALTDPQMNRMLDLENPEDIEDHNLGSTLDRLAYGGKFKDLVKAAKARENLFADRWSAAFAPTQVRTNQKLLEQAQVNPQLAKPGRALSRANTQLRPGEQAQVPTGMNPSGPAIQALDRRRGSHGPPKQFEQVSPRNAEDRSPSPSGQQDSPQGPNPPRFRQREQQQEPTDIQYF